MPATEFDALRLEVQPDRPDDRDRRYEPAVEVPAAEAAKGRPRQTSVSSVTVVTRTSFQS